MDAAGTGTARSLAVRRARRPGPVLHGARARCAVRLAWGGRRGTDAV